MPQVEDKWKTLLADLGRPTLRGIRKCPKCGTVNGTRGNSCKNKSCDVVFRGNGPRKKSNADACQITSLPESNQRIYSVRIRDRGPDYRNFVKLNTQGDVSNDDSVPGTSDAKCYVDACIRNKQQGTCAHILATQRCCTTSSPIHVAPSALSALNVPPEYMETLSQLINETPQLMVQRVSKTSFAVRCLANARHPLGFLHVVFVKPGTEDVSIERKYVCACRPVKLQSRDIEFEGSLSHENGNKLCIHYYECMCAFVSDASLAAEFENFLSIVFSPPLLSQLHLITLPHSSSCKQLDSMDPNQISVEIMRENISLLESIAAGDDSLENVQALEGVLSEQMIVASVDDSLNGNFDGSVALDVLDDTDEQIFASASSQNTIQLATFTTSESQLHDLEIMSTPVPNENDHANCSADKGLSSGKRMKEHNDSEPSEPHQIHLVPLRHKASSRTSKIHNSGVKQNVGNFSSASEGHVNEFSDVPCEVSGFELWLAGVNDRINATMNYQLTENPEPHTYYISSDLFEPLKDRITAGGKKKRLPNQTIVFNRTDKAPLGTFTKHTWKITNLIQIVHIFSSSMVRLKLKQYFFKTNNGSYIEWVPPVDKDEKNQRIVPILHCTYLKCGRNPLSHSRDITPFVIEWIPEILRESKLGELTLHFEFGKTGPIHEDESKSSLGPSKVALKPLSNFPY